jgi:hypothetical protein
MKIAFLVAIMAVSSITGTALADGVDGAWKINGEIFGNTIDTICTFATAAGKTTAACTIDGKPAAAAPVTIAGKDVTWDFDVVQAILTFKGKLNSDKAMKGDIETTGITGTFTAAKQ